MKISPDTNVLVRIIVKDDRAQARRALDLLERAELVAISSVALCEMVWVLRTVYKFSRQEILTAIALVINPKNTVVDRVVVEAGFKVFQSGGDFADGVIAVEGARLGGEVFASFDKKANSCVDAQGRPVRLLT